MRRFCFALAIIVSIVSGISCSKARKYDARTDAAYLQDIRNLWVISNGTYNVMPLFAPNTATLDLVGGEISVHEDTNSHPCITVFRGFNTLPDAYMKVARRDKVKLGAAYLIYGEGDNFSFYYLMEVDLKQTDDQMKLFLRNEIPKLLQKNPQK